MDRKKPWGGQHRRGHSLGSGGLRDKDEDLALFNDIAKRDKPPCLRTPDQPLDHHSPLSTKYEGLSHPHSAPPVERRAIGAELLNSDADKTDYDWLMTPPGTPLFPSLDADTPALHHGALINRSLTAIKTARQASTAPRGISPARSVSRGNPSPSRRPSPSRNSQISANHASSNNNQPATPTRSTTPSSRASPQIRQSTPTRQPSQPVTPLGARPATPTRRSPTPTTHSATTRPSTPTLRRSTSSPTGGSQVRNSSPARSTASTATSVAAARGPSPARGLSPARGVSPAPSSRGQSTSPSLRTPPDYIPPHLRTTPDRSSSAQRRPVAYGASPGDRHLARRTPSPARSVTSSLTRVERVSRGASSDSESSFDTGSQSGVSTHGLLTPERRGVFGLGTGVEYGRSSSLQQKTRRSGSSSSPQLGSSASKKSFESAAREYHRGQLAAFRPLINNSSISTFYSSRASGLLRRPLTPSSTCSSSEHGATVAHDSDEDVGSSSQWKPARKVLSGAHSPLHLFDKSLRDASTMDASRSIVDGNDELSSFFRNPAALEVESMSLPVASPCKVVDELETPEFVSELDWLISGNELGREYLRSKDIGGAGALISKQDSKQGSSGLEKIRDKLRHLKNTVSESNEAAESTPRAQQAQIVTRAATAPDVKILDDEGAQVELLLEEALCEMCGNWKHSCKCSATTSIKKESQTHESSIGRPATAPDVKILDDEGAQVELLLQEALCEMCGNWKHSCNCSATTSIKKESQTHESSIGRPSLTDGSSNVESAETVSKAASVVHARERDIWYEYKNSSEYEVPVAGFSETKMDPPKILAKEVLMRTSAQRECAREETPSPRIGMRESASSNGHNVTMETVPTEVPPCLISEAGSASTVAALHGKEINENSAAVGAADVERKKFEVGPPESLSAPHPEVTVLQKLNHSPCEIQRGNIIHGKQSEKERSQACGITDEVCNPVHMSSELPQDSQMPVLPHSSSETYRVNSTSQSFEGETRPEQGTGEGEGQVECGAVQAAPTSPVNSKRIAAVEDSHRRPEFSPSRSVEEEASERGVAAACAPATHWNEDHASVVPQVKKIIWQEEDLQPSTHYNGTRPEAGSVHSRTDEHERACRESDEVELEWGNGKVEEVYSVAGFHPQGSVESQNFRVARNIRTNARTPVYIVFDVATCQREVAHTHGTNGVDCKSTRIDNSGSFLIEPLTSAGQKYLLTGEIHVDSALYAAAHLSDDSLVIKVQSLDGQVLALDNPARLISEPNHRNSHAVYEYSHWAQVGAQLTFSAHYKREENSSSEILFYPREQQVHVTTDDKQPQIPEFKAMFAKGNVVPALDAAHATRVIEKSSAVEGLKSGGEMVETSSDGVYVAGPPYEDTTCLIQATSAGFHPSKQRNPELLLNAPDAKATQSTSDVPALEGNVDPATPRTQRVQVENVPFHNGELLQEVGTYNAVDPRAGALPHETTSTAEHFDYIFQCSDVKSDPCSAQPAVPEVLLPSVPEIPKPSLANDVNQSTNSSKKHIRQRTPPRSQSRDMATKSTTRADITPKSRVAVEAPVREEIVESADSPSPSTTRKHMSSFKFSHKKSSPSELKRSNTTFGSPTTAASKLGAQPSEFVNPGSKRSISNNKLPVNDKPASPHLNKGRSIRAASPARPPTNAKPATVAAALPGVSGEMALEEPSIHSRFSNITVRSGSDPENFDWGPSSLEETRSRCGSSSGTNAASMALLSSSPGSSPPLHDDVAMGDYHGYSEREGQSSSPESTYVLTQSSILNPRDSTAAGVTDDGSLASPRSVSTVGSSAMQRHHHLFPGVVRPHHGPTSVNNNNNNNNNNYAPKQNLDKLSEKLEQLEPFGARVLLYSPEQQFPCSSPPHGNPRRWQPAGVFDSNPHYLAKCNSSRSHGTVRLNHHPGKPNKCHCTIL